MSEEPDLVSLLYGADWTRLRLAAEVTASRDSDLGRTRYGTDAPPFLGAPGKPPGPGPRFRPCCGRRGCSPASPWSPASP